MKRVSFLILPIGLCVVLMLTGLSNALASQASHNSAIQSAQAESYNGLALTPPIGFNNWAHYECHINEQLFVRTADALVKKGLAKLGYNYVNIDDCWMKMKRDSHGRLAVNRKLFPHGLKWLGKYIHSKGLKFGIYEDAGYKTCQKAPGMYGHIDQDVKEFAAWGVDYLKLDYCYDPTKAFPGKDFSTVAHRVYGHVSQALRQSGRKIVFSCSPPAYVQNTPQYAKVMSWIGSMCNLWRTDNDIKDAWKSVVSNYEGNVHLGRYAHPGGWNDADMLEVGNSGLSPTEQRSQFSLWAEMASPLLISTDVAKLSPQALAILSNKAVIAVDQDPLGVQAHVVKAQGDVDVLSRPLVHGDRAVAFFNKGDKPAQASVILARLGLSESETYQARNLWSKKTVRPRTVLQAKIPAHGVVIYRISQSHSQGASGQ
jgi:alpha-galactosidase